MKTISILFLSILISTSFVFSQIEVPIEKYPFYKVLEWPNQGSLLLAKDPNGRTNDLFINLLNNKGEITWGKTIYANSEDPKAIVSNQSNYVYFVDNFKPENNNIHYNQVNQSGGIVSTKFDVLQVIRQLGYTTPNDLELKEIANTPKAIVFYFQLPVKSKGIVENIFITITHHNNRAYDYKGPTMDMKSMKNGTVDPILFAGADESTISFSYYSNEGNINSVNFINFSPKGEEILDHNFKIPSGEYYTSTIENLALSGGIYVEDKTAFQSRGKGVYINKKYYFLLNEKGTNCLKIYGENENGKIVVLNSCNKTTSNSRNPKSSISYFNMDGNLFIISEINEDLSADKITENGIEKSTLNKKDIENVQLNLSSFKIKDKSTNFVHLINGTPYYTNSKDMEKQDKIIFKQ